MYYVDVGVYADNAYTQLWSVISSDPTSEIWNYMVPDTMALGQLRYSVASLQMLTGERMNQSYFYAVSSSGQRQQMYTVRI